MIIAFRSLGIHVNRSFKHLQVCTSILCSVKVYILLEYEFEQLDNIDALFVLTNFFNIKYVKYQYMYLPVLGFFPDVDEVDIL